MIEETSISNLAPLATALPPAPKGDIFTPEQWSTFLSICEVYFPQIPLKSAQTSTAKSKSEAAKAEIQKYLPPDTSPDVVDRYLAETFDRDDLKEALRRRIGMHVAKSQIGGMAFVFSALNTRVGSYIMTGSTTPLQNRSIEERTRIVCNWSVSYLKPLRDVFSSLQILAKITWIAQSKTLHQVTGFPMVPKHAERNEGYQFDFRGFENTPETKTVELEYDVVIVGSGCGAGVMASHLGRAAAEIAPGKKLRVVVLEKSFHFPSTHFPMNTAAAGENLMEGGGAVQADDGSIAVIAGSTWGGGGTVNWSASLQPQSFVREEWTEKDGLSLFATGEFQDCLDTVCDRMGVCKMTDEAAKAQIPQSFGNEKLLEGARRLGLAAEVVPQNSNSKAHRCGHCSEGCAGATKQGPANCWLPDAAEHGVEFIEGCFVDEILWDSDTSATTPRKVVGLKAEWTSRDRSTRRQLFIKSKRVVVSAGTLQSPALLIRSGITNTNVGANLHLHPTMCTGIVWPERADPWEGPILTAAVTAFENVDGEGHGSKVELIAGTAGWMLPWMPWTANATLEAMRKNTVKDDESALYTSALDYKVQAAKFGHTVGFIAIQRDRDTGRVFLEPKDSKRRQIRINYNASPRDRSGLLAGVIAGARIAYVMGAKEIRPFCTAVEPFVRSDTASLETNNEAFQIWIQETKERWTNDPENCRFGSAHQMGTCRMSSRREQGVIDSSGKVWDCEGLYVADASAFPSASGVNPMVTAMGISEHIARGIVKEIRTKGL